MKSLATFALSLFCMTSAAFAKSGLPALDAITDLFSNAGSHSSWVFIAVIAFVIYVASSAHRA